MYTGWCAHTLPTCIMRTFIGPLHCGRCFVHLYSVQFYLCFCYCPFSCHFRCCTQTQPCSHFGIAIHNTHARRNTFTYIAFVALHSQYEFYSITYCIQLIFISFRLFHDGKFAHFKHLRVSCRHSTDYLSDVILVFSFEFFDSTTI